LAGKAWKMGFVTIPCTDPVIFILFCGTLPALMDAKTLNTLEYPKILERLASYCAFAASADKARQLQPSDDLVEVQERQARTREAHQMLLTRPDLTIGGARDIRASIDLARHGGVLLPADLLDIKYTLIAGRNLVRTFERLESQFPNLFQIAQQLPVPVGLIDAISRAITDRGEILDSASPKLAIIRRDMRIAHDRLMAKLQRMVSDPKNTPYLQEALITQRDGRYVLPLRAEFKGRIKSIVHDQSSSGATPTSGSAGTGRCATTSSRMCGSARRSSVRAARWRLSTEPTR
jgi:DNA mismatch repair protein MutS2